MGADKAEHAGALASKSRQTRSQSPRTGDTKDNNDYHQRECPTLYTVLSAGAGRRRCIHRNASTHNDKRSSTSHLRTERSMGAAVSQTGRWWQVSCHETSCAPQQEHEGLAIGCHICRNSSVLVFTKLWPTPPQTAACQSQTHARRTQTTCAAASGRSLHVQGCICKARLSRSNFPRVYGVARVTKRAGR